MPAYSASTLAKSSQLNQARGPSAAAREARGPSAAARQARGPRALARQARGSSAAAREVRGPRVAAREARGQSAGDRQAERVKIKEMRFIINTAHSILPNVFISTRQKETGNYCKKFPHTPLKLQLT